MMQRANLGAWTIVAASLAAATSMHALFRPALELVPFMLFHAANFASAWYGGLVPGLACTLLGAVVVNVLFLARPAITLPEAIATGVFVAIGTGFSILCQSRVRALRRADDALAVREDFLGVAAHELRTPLTTLRLRLQRLISRPERLTEPRDDDLVSALRQVMRMDGLIHELLDAVHLQQARIKLNRKDVDLGALARDVVGRRVPSLLACLEVDVPAPVVGSFDAVRLEHVIASLLLNAFKFGQGEPVRLRVEQRGNRALLSVQDHGIGIDRRDQERIFRRFERASSPRNYGGLGLGLWIASEFVEAHGGTIRVESEAGKGATFTVDLPLQPLH
jgi:signal transduction histidine kinase